jgi:hypothetical protein
MQQTLNGTPHITFVADSPGHRDDELAAAVTSLRDAAIELRMGILVTRKSARSFTITVSPAVPFGTTEELDEALVG